MTIEIIQTFKVAGTSDSEKAKIFFSRYLLVNQVLAQFGRELTNSTKSGRPTKLDHSLVTNNTWRTLYA
jgi:hypothetical protein